MKNVNICKAQGIGSLHVAPVTITVDGEIDTYKSTIDQMENFMDYEAKILEEALHNSLPGGTYNRLLAVMTKRTAGCLVIPRPR